MWLILRLAARNLLRNKRRSVLTLLAVIIPVMLLDLMWGFTGAFERSLFENTVRLETGHIQIHESGYRIIGQTIPIIRDVRPAVEALQQTDRIEHYTVRVELPALAASGNTSKGVLVQGVEPERSRQMSLMSRWIDRGRYLHPDDRGAAVAGAALLGELGIGLGEQLILLVSHPELGTGVLTPTVVGILDAPSRELSRGVVQVTLADARRALDLPNAATSVIALVVGVTGPWDTEIIDEATEELRERLGSAFTVETWREVSPQTVGFLSILKPINLGFMTIFFALAGLVVLNTLYLNVLERTHELGMVLALGAGRHQVLLMTTAEALVIALLGALIGSALGVGLVLHWSDGLVLPDIYKEVYAQVGLRPVLYLTMTPGQAAISALVTLAVAWLASWLPARGAARLEPVEAMRAA